MVWTLASLYDGDLRTKNENVKAISEKVAIPHPIHGASYADGDNPCTHARLCPWPARKDFK